MINMNVSLSCICVWGSLLKTEQRCKDGDTGISEWAIQKKIKRFKLTKTNESIIESQKIPAKPKQMASRAICRIAIAPAPGGLSKRQENWHLVQQTGLLQ